MSLDGFQRLHADADARKSPVPLAVAGGDDPTVLEALRTAADRGWVSPILVGPESAARAAADAAGIDLGGFTLLDADGASIAPSAVAAVRSGRASILMKGRIDTPSLIRAVLDPGDGLRTDRVVCQVVLMELPRDGRRILLADTGVNIRPRLHQKIDILRSASELARSLGVDRPRIALMAASESVNPSMPETVEAAALQSRNRQGEFPDCIVQGPLSFDLAYAPLAADRKRIAGEVVGVADALIFHDLLSANLTVKAIMYTADCQFGGLLRGTTSPVVFMSRADSVPTRLNSLALTLRTLDP